MRTGTIYDLFVVKKSLTIAVVWMEMCIFAR